MEATEIKVNKKIATFSWLVRRAEAMSRNDPDEFYRLKDSHSLAFLPGCRVSMSINPLTFTLRSTVSAAEVCSAKAYCIVRGRQINGEWCTVYETLFSTTKWRKSMEKFMPFTMLAKPSWDRGAPCLLHNADGTVADHHGRWESGRRGKPGRFSSRMLVIRDRDGKFMDCIKLGEAKVEAERVGMYKNLELKSACEICEEIQNNNYFPNDLLCDFLPGSCGKRYWYESMIAPAGRPTLWNERQVKLLAARAHAEAIRLAEASSQIKIALYPMERFSVAKMRSSRGQIRFSSHRRRAVSLEWLDGNADLWLMPELVAYWIEPHKILSLPGVVCFIRVVIPPSGNPTLERDGSSPMSAVRLDESGHISPRARAFHGMRCLQAEFSKTYRLGNALPFKAMEWSEERDRVFVDFHNNTDLVMVNDLSSQEMLQAGRDGEFVGVRAEDAFSSIAERTLLGSLPLC
jgi:hypothetical protein